MLIGYARVSTQDQHLDLQMDALKAAGCERIFTDQCSGAKSERPGLAEALEYIRSGDTLVVWKLDRMGRSLRHLIDIINGLADKDIQFKSLQESIDTSTPGGKLVFHVFGAVAEFERDLIRERVNAGLTAARSRGRLGGRPTKLTEDQIKIAIALAGNPDLTVKAICEQVGCSRATYYRQVAPRLKPVS